MKKIEICPSCRLEVIADRQTLAGKAPVCPRCELPLPPARPATTVVLQPLDGFSQPVQLRQGNNTIGRKSPRSQSEIQLDDPTKLISKTHAVLVVTGSKVSVRDAGSANGTFVNERRLVGISQIDLKPGDRLRLGSKEFTISIS